MHGTHFTPDPARRLRLVTDGSDRAERANDRGTAASPPACAGDVYERDGLRVALLGYGVHWVPFLAPEGQPTAVAVLPNGRWLTYRVLADGEDWRAVERALWAQLRAAVRLAAIETA